MFKKFGSKTLISLFIFSTVLSMSIFAFPQNTEAQSYPCQITTTRNSSGDESAGLTELRIVADDKACAALGGIKYQNPQETITSSIDSSKFWLKQVIEPALAWVATTVLQIVSLLTGLAGVLLNGIVYLTVVKVADNYSNISAINVTWGVVRDVANMSFIFILLYAAIRTILGMEGGAQKIVVKVVVVAVLINFSLFFTKVVIDTSNVLALFFYDSIAPSSLNAAFDVSSFESVLKQRGLSNAFMQFMNVTSLYQTVGGESIDSGSIITIGVLGSVMLLIAAFIFAAVAIMFIIRYVVLIFVLILSPIAFLGFALPGAEGLQKKWLDALIGQAFFAPVYFFMTWITLKILAGIMKANVFLPPGEKMAQLDQAALGSLSTVTQTQTIDTGVFGMIINFIVVITFLIASLVISKKWADGAGQGMNKATSWAMGKAGGASFGLAARTGRFAVGGVAEMAKDTSAYRRLEAASARGGATGFLSKAALSRVDKTSKASFDFRNSRAGGVVLSEFEAGKAKEGGFEADRKAYREYFEKPGTDSYKKRQERGRGAEVELAITKNNNLSAIGSIDSLNNEERDINDAIANAGGVATAAQTARLAAITAEKTRMQPMINAFEESIGKATGKEIEAIVNSNRRLLQSQEFANRISVQQLEAINKSDKFSEQEKDALKKNRFSFSNDLNDPAGLAALAVTASARTPAQIIDANRVTRAITKTKGLSDSEIEMMDPKWVDNNKFISNMKQSQVDAAIKNSKTTQSQKEKIRKVRRQPILDAINTGGDVKKLIKKTDADVLVSYMNTPNPTTRVNIALEPDVLMAYEPNILKKMAAKMTSEDIQTLRTKLVGDPTATPPIPPGGHPDTVKWLNDPAVGKGLDIFN